MCTCYVDMCLINRLANDFVGITIENTASNKNYFILSKAVWVFFYHSGQIELLHLNESNLGNLYINYKYPQVYKIFILSCMYKCTSCYIVCVVNFEYVRNILIPNGNTVYKP